MTISRLVTSSGEWLNMSNMTDEGILGVLNDIATEISDGLAQVQDWGLSGLREGQYNCDIVADNIAIARLLEAGFDVLSEESGYHHNNCDLLAVVDPVDGSTNASAGIPYYATSIAVMDNGGIRVGLVVNQATGTRYEASRGAGARKDGIAIEASKVSEMADAMIGMNGWSQRHLGWRQYRVLGAAALEICAVAEGALDAYVDLSEDGLAPWDYMAALLICEEAGATVTDLSGLNLKINQHEDRRHVLAAGSSDLHKDLHARLLVP